MFRGYVYIWRSLKDAPFYKDSKAVHLALHLILGANHKENSTMIGHQPVIVKRGQVIVGRLNLARETGLGQQEVRTALNKLKNTGFLTINPTNKFSIVTICNYDFYQNKDNYTNQQPNQQYPKNQPALNQQLTTNNNEKNGINEGIKESESIFEHYRKVIKNGAKAEASVNIQGLLKGGYTKEILLKTVDRYKAQIDRENIEEKYRTQANNFFKQDGRFIDYLEDKKRKTIKINPNCPVCSGRGSLYSPGSGKTTECYECAKGTWDEGNAN